MDPQGNIKENSIKKHGNKFVPKHVHYALAKDETLVHSLPATDFNSLLMPLDLSTYHLQNFHRIPFNFYPKENYSKPRKYNIYNLTGHIKTKKKEWQQRLNKCPKNSPLLASLEDLSAKNGELILLEYSEQYPPLIMNVGMASKITNYFNKRTVEDFDKNLYEYGSPAVMSSPLFLGSLKPRESLQVFENNLFRAPIFSHFVPETDFLIIRNQERYYIREVRTIFVVAQLCPKVQVPYPFSTHTCTLFNSLLQITLYRLFKINEDKPILLTSSQLKEKFPGLKSQRLRRNLNLLADYKKPDSKNNKEGCWILKPNMKNHYEELVQKLVLPEDYCKYMSMEAGLFNLSGHKRNSKNFISEKRSEIFFEVTSPWQTTNSFLRGIVGGCKLEIYGPADPTGCGEAFSYAPKREGKPFNESKVELDNLCDEDLRDLLKELFGEPQEEVEELNRNELLEVLQLVLCGETCGKEMVDMFIKVKRTFWLLSDYEKECQKIFDLQNRKLSSEAIISSDNEISEEESVNGDNVGITDGQILKIYRTFKDDKGQEYTRLETVRDSRVIDGYIRLKNKLNKEERANWDEEKLKEMRKEKRRIQEKLRNIKKTLERLTLDKEEKSVFKKDLKLKCGSCGAVGHMKTNKHCPLYPKKDKKKIEEENLNIYGNVSVEGTKISISISKDTDEVNHKLSIEDMNSSVSHCKKRRHAGKVHCDYLQKYNKSVSRRRTDPTVTISIIFEEILNKLRDLPESTAFLLPVSVKSAPSYHLIVKRPMDLQTMRQKLRENNYKSSEDFLNDVKQILENSILFNGKTNAITQAARRLLESCEKFISEKRSRLQVLEMAINPLLDSPQASLNFILETLLETRLLNIPDVSCFVNPVNRKKYKDYYSIIKTPMYLDLISKKLQNMEYSTKTEFLADIETILNNCKLYNGDNNPLTNKAKELHRTCQILLSEEYWNKYQNFIKETNKEALMVYIQSISVSNHDNSLEILQQRLFDTNSASKFVNNKHSPKARKTFPSSLQGNIHNLKKPKLEEVVLKTEIFGANITDFCSFRDLITSENKKEALLQNNHKLSESINSLNPFVKLECLKNDIVNELLTKPLSHSKFMQLRNAKPNSYKSRRQSSCSEVSVGRQSDQLDITDASEFVKIEKSPVPLQFSIINKEKGGNCINDCGPNKHRKKNKWRRMDIGLQLLKELRRAEKQAKKYRLSNFLLEEFQQTLQGVISKLNTLSLTDPNIYSHITRSHRSFANYLANIVPLARKQDLRTRKCLKLSVKNNIASFLRANQKLEISKIETTKRNPNKRFKKDTYTSFHQEKSFEMDISKNFDQKSYSALSLSVDNDKKSISKITSSIKSQRKHLNSENLQPNKNSNEEPSITKTSMDLETGNLRSKSVNKSFRGKKMNISQKPFFKDFHIVDNGQPLKLPSWIQQPVIKLVKCINSTTANKKEIDSNIVKLEHYKTNLCDKKPLTVSNTDLSKQIVTRSSKQKIEYNKKNTSPIVLKECTEEKQLNDKNVQITSSLKNVNIIRSRKRRRSFSEDDYPEFFIDCLIHNDSMKKNSCSFMRNSNTLNITDFTHPHPLRKEVIDNEISSFCRNQSPKKEVKKHVIFATNPTYQKMDTIKSIPTRTCLIKHLSEPTLPIKPCLTKSSDTDFSIIKKEFIEVPPPRTEIGVKTLRSTAKRKAAKSLELIHQQNKNLSQVKKEKITVNEESIGKCPISEVKFPDCKIKKCIVYIEKLNLQNTSSDIIRVNDVFISKPEVAVITSLKQEENTKKTPIPLSKSVKEHEQKRLKQKNEKLPLKTYSFRSKTDNAYFSLSSGSKRHNNVKKKMYPSLQPPFS